MHARRAVRRPRIPNREVRGLRGGGRGAEGPRLDLGDGMVGLGDGRLVMIVEGGRREEGREKGGRELSKRC